MAEPQLFCVAEDRHRAVLLVDMLAGLGWPVTLFTEPAAPRAKLPKFVVWTRSAADEAWIRELFDTPGVTVALVFDPVELPAGCQHRVDLSNWPARSADANIFNLVRWLQDPVREPVTAGQVPGAGREPGSFGLLALLGLVALVFGVLIWKDSGSEAGREDQLPAEPEAVWQVSPSSADTSEMMGVAATEAGSDGGDAPSAQAATRLSAAQPHGAAVAVEEGVAHETAIAAQGDNVEQAIVASQPVTVSTPADRGSLAHLCRARSVAAARAWYGVLTAEQREQAVELQCVRSLLENPEFAELREVIEA